MTIYCQHKKKKWNEHQNITQPLVRHSHNLKVWMVCQCFFFLSFLRCSYEIYYGHSHHTYRIRICIFVPEKNCSVFFTVFIIPHQMYKLNGNYIELELEYEMCRRSCNCIHWKETQAMLMSTSDQLEECLTCIYLHLLYSRVLGLTILGHCGAGN